LFFFVFFLPSVNKADSKQQRCFESALFTEGKKKTKKSSFAATKKAALLRQKI